MAKEETNSTPLWKATKNGDFDTVKRLIENGADVDEPNDKGLTPFMWAVQKNRLDIAKYLLDHGAKVNATNNYSLSPLMWAVVNSPNLAIIRFLLENGADVNEKSETDVHGEEGGETPLLRAVYCRRPGNVMYNRAKLLIEYGADITARDSNGCTVLIRAAWGGNLDVIKLLIEKGLDVNAKDNGGWTSLIYAAARGNLDVVKILTEKGANLNIQDDEGKTALMRAEENKHSDVAKFLREQGANADSQNIKISEQQSKNMANDNPPENDSIQNDANNKSAVAHPHKCWWAVASPNDEGWKDANLADYKIGQVQTYKLLKKNGKFLKLERNFRNAKIGDIVIGYQTGDGYRNIVALCEVVESVNKDDSDTKKNIKIIKTAHLKEPIAFTELKKVPELSELEAIRNNNQGAFFKVTKREAKILMELILEKEKNKGIEEVQRVYKQIPLLEEDEEEMPRPKKEDIGGKEGEQKEELIKKFLEKVYLGKDYPEGKERYEMLESLLKNKKNIILQGPPGVGKTFAATRLAYSLLGLNLDELEERGNKDPRIVFVQFHQNYSYEDFVEGYKPKKGGNFKLQKGIFYKFCKEAQKKEAEYKKDLEDENIPETEKWRNCYFLIIDEINRGNTSKIFGELLMLIENGYRGEKHAITLAHEEEDEANQKNPKKEDKRFYVPENLYIIGMMNTADRSLAMLDYALRRRFGFFGMRPAFDSDRFRKYQDELSNPVFNNLIGAIKELNKKIAKDKSLGQDFCIGHSYFCNWDECTEGKMRNAVWCDILPLLKEYYFDNPTRYVECLKPLSSTNLLPQEEKEKLNSTEDNDGDEGNEGDEEDEGDENNEGDEG